MKNQSGMGLVGVVIAAALVIIAALAVSSFITNQSSQSKRLELSGSCQNIAATVIEYLKKDEGSLWISSYGPAPGSTRYASKISETDDGYDRFVMSGRSTLFMGPAGFQLSLENGDQTLPNTWKYFNHLNIKNSSNRLAVLVANGPFCCESGNISDPNCGAVFISDRVSRSGFVVADKNIEIKLAVNLRNASGSLCAGKRQLTAADLNSFDSRFNGTVEFTALVTVGKGTANENKCSAMGSIHQNSDVTPSLTLIELQNKPRMCGTKSGLPSNCNAVDDVVYRLRTVTNDGSCTSNCLAQIQSQTCSNISTNDLSLFNSFTHASCVNNCRPSEPGSAFLCKIGEKNWFNNPANANRWEPCEIANVYDFNNSIMSGANVTVQYVPEFNDTAPETTTNANLRITGLTQGRAYIVDVRAIDTSGNVGPSFCSSSPSSCDTASNPHFIIIPGIPTIGSMTDVQNYVNTTGAQKGSDLSLISTGKYSGALSPLGANQFQCQSGTPEFFVPITYSPPPGAYSNYITTSCVSRLTPPSGIAATPFCTCTSGACSSLLPASAASGDYQYTMTISNDCGGAPTIRNRNWCTDNNIAIGITDDGDQTFGSSPDFSNFVNYPSAATKACGIVSLCPNDTGGFIPTIGACPNAALNWNPMVHSGCLADPAKNYCMLAMDPCGRSQPTTAVEYSTRLMGVPLASSEPNNKCFDYTGVQVCGNDCVAGSYCDSGGVCRTTCATLPCPTNTSTPIGANNGPIYCPTYNSCTAPIGGTPSSPTCNGGFVIGACHPTTHGQPLTSAPSSNLCTAGTATAVSVGPGPWTWTCRGVGGGFDAICSTAPVLQPTLCWGNVTAPALAKKPTAECLLNGTCLTLNQATTTKCMEDNADGSQRVMGSGYNIKCIDPKGLTPGVIMEGCSIAPNPTACSWVEVSSSLTNNGDCESMVGSGPVRPPSTPCTSANVGEKGNWAGCKGSSLLDVDFECQCGVEPPISACTTCKWKAVGSEDIGCGYETCNAVIGTSCPGPGGIKMCCRGPVGQYNMPVAGRRQELTCAP